MLDENPVCQCCDTAACWRAWRWLPVFNAISMHLARAQSASTISLFQFTIFKSSFYI